MIVRELIAILKQYPESTRIVVAGNEGGYCDIHELKKIPIKLNVYPKDSWCGPHEKVDDSQKHEDVVVII